MALLLTVVAFAWFMALNFSILLYQQHNAALMAHVRNNYPLFYEQIKNQLSFSLFYRAQSARSIFENSGQAEIVNDPLIKGVLNDLSRIRQRGLRTLGVMTILLLVVALLTIF